MFNSFLHSAALVAMSVAAPALSTSASAQTAAAKPAASTRVGVAAGLDTNFKAMDGNKDGSLNAAELTAAESKGQQRQLAAARTRVESQFTKLDTNRDGQLSKAEFMAAAPQSAPPPNGAALLGRLDKNKDGKISADEYRAPVLAVFDSADTNKDGTLTDAERKAAQAKMRR